jgi:GH15 family glucan-1,4-alpha-glucosidase
MTTPTTPSVQLVPIEILAKQLNELHQAIQTCAGTTGDWTAVALRDQSSGATLVAGSYAKSKGQYPKLTLVMPDQTKVDEFFQRRMIEEGIIKSSEAPAVVLVDQDGKDIAPPVQFDELCYAAAALDIEVQKVNKLLGMPTYGAVE